MYYILMSIDNYNRDFHPDRIHKVSESKEELDEELKKYNNSNRYFQVVDENYSFNFDSNFDLIDEVPTFNVFCQYTGCNLLTEEKALELYIKQFKIKG